MAFTKIVIFYNQGPRGFSETYWLPDQNPKAAADGLTNQFLNAMVGFRAQNTSIYAIRASNEGPPRLSYLRLAGFQFQGASGLTAESLPDVITTTAVVRLSSAAGVTRRVFLRGLPDDLVVRNIFARDTPPAAMIAAIDKYTKALATAGMQIRYQLRPPAGGLAFQQVSALIQPPDLPQYTQITFVPVAGFAPVTGANIVFSGIDPRLRDFPRIAKITSVGVIGVTQTLNIAYRMPAGGLVSPAKMKMLNLVYGLSPIAEGDFERFSEHKTGRPFGLLRGRSRAVLRVG